MKEVSAIKNTIVPFVAGLLLSFALVAVLSSPVGRTNSTLFSGAIPAGRVEAAVADEAYSPVSPSGPGGVSPITVPGSILPEDDPAQMASKSAKLISDIYTDLSHIILPLAMLAMLVSCIVLIAGRLLGIQVVSRYGWGGLLTSCLGLAVYYSIPLLIALISTFVARLT